ncbi:hypothetical protein CR513_42619, partial [Mucuna pruriens]
MERSNQMCIMIMKRSILKVFRGSISESQTRLSNSLPKIKRRRQSLKLEFDEDLIVYLILISLLAHFGQFKVSYNTQKDKWSLNELIPHYVQEEERLLRDKTESNKKRKNINGVVEGSSHRKKPKKNEEFTCFFYKKSGHMKK